MTADKHRTYDADEESTYACRAEHWDAEQR